jgi:hypothetical protein
MFFLLFLHDDRRIRIRIQSRIRIRIQTSDKWIRIQEAQKHVDPVDPDSDPQHCSEQTKSYGRVSVLGTLSLAAILTANLFPGKQCSGSESKLLHCHMPRYLGFFSVPYHFNTLKSKGPEQFLPVNVAVEFF